MKTTNYTEKRHNTRIRELAKQVKKSQDNDNAYKFTALDSTPFEKGEFKAYKDAVEEYHGILATVKSPKARDKALVNVLEYLCCKPEETAKIITSNPHETIIKASYKFRQVMTKDARDEKKALSATIFLAENGFTVEDGAKIEITEEKAETIIKTCKARIIELETGAYFEKASFKQVSPSAFRKSLEFIIGGIYTDTAIVEKFKSSQWARWEKQCEKYGVAHSVWESHFEKVDKEGMKKTLKEAKEAKEKAE